MTRVTLVILAAFLSAAGICYAADDPESVVGGQAGCEDFGSRSSPHR